MSFAVYLLCRSSPVRRWGRRGIAGGSSGPRGRGRTGAHVTSLWRHGSQGTPAPARAPAQGRPSRSIGRQPWKSRTRDFQSSLSEWRRTNRREQTCGFARSQIEPSGCCRVGRISGWEDRTIWGKKIDNNILRIMGKFQQLHKALESNWISFTRKQVINS